MSFTNAIKKTFGHEQPERVQQRAPTVAPLVDVYENPNEIVLWADVPGATRDGVDVHLDKGELTLSARRATKEGEPTANDYHRVFAVPTGIDAAKIDAELKAGVLKVRLPKSDAMKARRIEVKAS